ncbi:hypothetical protein ACFX14_002883 [Malus domestica]
MIFRFIKGVTYPTDIFDSHMASLKIVTHRQSVIAALPDEEFNFVGYLQPPNLFPGQVVRAVFTRRSPTFPAQSAILH